jgi:hypothetical protein
MYDSYSIVLLEIVLWVIFVWLGWHKQLFCAVRAYRGLTDRLWIYLVSGRSQVIRSFWIEGIVFTFS